MKIYLVTNGEVYDYCIYGVYSTLELAEEAKDLYCAYKIEEFDLDKIPDHPKGLLPYWVDLDKDGNILGNNKQRIGRLSVDFNMDPGWEPTAMFKAQSGPIPIYSEDDPRFEETVFRGVKFYVLAKNEEHAINVANEKRIELISSGEWTVNRKEWLRRKQR